MDRHMPLCAGFFSRSFGKMALCALILCQVYTSYGADRYAPGETLYVWARSGLNLRAEPDKSSKVIKALPYGSRVTIVNKTDLAYATTIFPASKEERNPYILKGHWVRVSQEGKTGYLFDAYILAQEPALSEENDFTSYLERFLVSSYVNGGEGDEYADLPYTKKEYANDVSATFGYGEETWEENFTFRDATLEEILVQLQYFLGPEAMDYCELQKNWKETLCIQLENCSYEISEISGRIRLYKICFDGC